MKVLLVNTSERIGGAAVAASRLLYALKQQGIDAKMLVRDKQSDNPDVIALPHNFIQKIRFFIDRLWVYVINGFSRKGLFDVDFAKCGCDITKLLVFKEADVIHLHWINQGMLSLSDLDKIFKSGKKIVWTMHDMWPITSICHHSRKCSLYRNTCRYCHMLNFPKYKDISTSIFYYKSILYKNNSVTFVACSNWLKHLAEKSALLNDKNKVISIPNVINTSIFKPLLKKESRSYFSLPLDKKLILFGALRVTNKQKGIDYLVEACNILNKKYNTEDLQIVVFGNSSCELENLIKLPIISLNYISNEIEIAQLYNAVDLFVTPSLEENLPNMIMESMACGTPCIGFNVGGIPEMIDHKQNGYVAEYKNSEDLALGINWVLYESEYDKLSTSSVNKVIKNYSEEVVVKLYINQYKKNN